MAFFKSDEEKAREAAEQAAAEQEMAEALAARKEATARKAWLESPLGKATAAKESGDRFLELQLEVGMHHREAPWGARDYASDERVISSASMLQKIEEVGWSLEHVGYVFKMTGQSSSEKWLASGQQTAVSGITVGIYLFRNAQSDR